MKRLKNIVISTHSLPNFFKFPNITFTSVNPFPMNQDPNFLHLICMTRKINYIIGMIWWQFRKKKIKRRLFEGINNSKSSKISKL